MTVHSMVLSRIFEKVKDDPTILDNDEKRLIERCRDIDIGWGSWKDIDKDKLIDIYIRIY